MLAVFLLASWNSNKEHAYKEAVQTLNTETGDDDDDDDSVSRHSFWGSVS